MKNALSVIGLLLACATLSPVRSHATVSFQLRSAATDAASATVSPGSNVNLELATTAINAEAGVEANLDSFTYRIIFPNQDFTLIANAFDAPFDNAQVPGGFNGSIPWAGLPLAINFSADVGSPGATAAAADIYRTTATTTGVPVTSPGVLEQLTVQAPTLPGVYSVVLNVLEAADRNGALHTVNNGTPFILTVEVNPCSPDVTAPVVTINGVSPTTVQCGGAFSDPGASAIDACAGAVAVSASGAVNTAVPGNYTITYSATDPSGNIGSATRTVQVVDTVAPVITLNGTNPLTIECHSTFTDPGATATDACAGAVSVSTFGTVDPNAAGTYILTYTATDPSGNVRNATRMVVVQDTISPVVTVTGANPLFLECHTSFVDPGASATDACAGALAASASGTVDANTPGNYTLTYTAMDPSGNAGTATRTVTVVDTIAPVITLNGADPIIIECHSPFVDPGAAASDACAGPRSVSVSGTVDINTSGTYTLIYTAIDPAGNTATATRRVRVLACAGFALNCPPNITAPTDDGVCSAIVTYEKPLPVGAVGSVIVVCNPPSGSIFPAGDTTVTCTATDSIGQTASCTFIVTVEDDVPPEITCPPDVTVACLGEVPAPDFAAGVVADLCDVSPVVIHVSDVSSGSNPTIITRTYEATDASGNSATCEQIITVTGLVGDLNGDCCVDRSDLALIMVQIRARADDLNYDINRDGRLDIADARALVLRFTNPGGSPCQ